MSAPVITAELLPPMAMPSHPEWNLPIITAPEWDSLLERQNAWRLDLDPNDNEPKCDGIAPTYSLGMIDTRLSGWTPVVPADEASLVADAVAGYQERIDEIDAEANPSEDDLDEKYQLQTMINDLNLHAYWGEVPNAFGDGGTALYRRLSAPNIPFETHSNETLQVDRPFTIFLYRWQPDKAQQNQRLDFDFGHWRIRFEKDDRAKLFRFKTGVPRGTIVAVEAQIQAIVDGGKLTGPDKVNIADWKEQIKTIKATAKKAKRELTADEESQIATLQSQIDSLKLSKTGLEQAEENAKKTLEDSIYLDTTDLNLQETTGSLFNTHFSLTIIPQQRGYMLIAKDEGKNQFVYEDKEVTATKNFQYMVYDSAATTTKPDRTWSDIVPARMVISGNGGAFMCAVGNPQIAKYFKLTSRYHSLGWEWDGSGSSFSGVWNQLPGTNVTFTATPSADNRSVAWIIEGTTDGRYMPFVYSIDLQIEGGARVPDDSIVWASENVLAYQCLLDAQPEFDGDILSRGYRMTFLDIDGAAAELFLSYNYRMRLYADGQAIYTGHISDVDIAETHRDDNGYTAEITLMLSDSWWILDEDEMLAAFTGDDLQLAPYVRRVLKGRGFADDEIITDNAPTIKLPKAAPGEEPKVRPESFAKRGEWLRYLHDTFAYKSIFYFDALGKFVFEPMNTTTSGATFTTYYEDPPGRYTALRPLKRKPNFKDFYNSFWIVGGKDPVTKKKYAATYQDTTSIADTPANRVSDRWIGRVKPYRPSADENLNNQELVNASLRRAQELYGQPRYETEFATFYHGDEFSIRDRFMLDDTPVELIAISGASVKDDRMTFTVRDL